MNITREGSAIVFDDLPSWITLSNRNLHYLNNELERREYISMYFVQQGPCYHLKGVPASMRNHAGAKVLGDMIVEAFSLEGIIIINHFTTDELIDN